MMKINLHTHSNHSLDGVLDINEVIKNGIDNGIQYLSITDHDNCDAYLELDKKLLKNINIIYGMEADALVNNVTYDILCYGFNLDNVKKWAREQYGTIVTRQTKIYNKLVEKCTDLGLILDSSNPFNPEIEFAHPAIYRMLNSNENNKSFLDKYNISNGSDFYRLSTGDNTFPLYIDMSIVWPTIEVLSKVIHDNGGKIFLAHPYKYKGKNVDDVLESCSSYVDGIEISNENKSKDEVDKLYEYAKEKNLLISAGSDYHGSEKHNSLDVNYLDDNKEQEIIEWINTIIWRVN